MSMQVNYNYMVVNTIEDGNEANSSPLSFFEDMDEARSYIESHFNASDMSDAGYLIVPLDKCTAVWAEMCASKFTDVGYEDVV